MKKVLVIGCGGAGKSTLSRLLHEKTGIPLVHLDKLYWYGVWQHLDRDAFIKRIQPELERDSFIMDGNFISSLPLRLRYADTVIMLDYSRVVCLFGAIRRICWNYGKTREDMGGECAEKFDMEFLGWIWNFKRKTRPKIMTALEEANGVKLVVLKNRAEARRFLESAQ